MESPVEVCAGEVYVWEYVGIVECLHWVPVEFVGDDWQSNQAETWMDHGHYGSSKRAS